MGRLNSRCSSSRLGRVAITLIVATGLILSVCGFGDGRYPVGSGAGRIPPGTYTTAGGANCYWERGDLFGGIVANEFEPNPQRTIVTIHGTDATFESSRCGDWQPLSGAPLTIDRNAPFPDGTWRVGVDIAGNNRWLSTAATGSCYWARLRDFYGQGSSIIDNSFGAGPTLVVLSPGDVGFYSSGCGAWVRDTSLDAFGSLDRATAGSGGIRVVGWARDRETAAPIAVHLYVDGQPRSVATANRARPDVGSHGFDAVVNAGAGTHQVCAYGISVGLGLNGQLGCRTVTVIGNPIGNLDRLAYSPNGLRASGWALDPNTVSPINVHIYVDGVAKAVVTASSARPDIARAFPGYGGSHGFASTVPIGGGTHTVCAYGINVAVGANALLGCRAFVTPTDPLGHVDAITAQHDVVRVRGWAIDPNTANPIAVHVYVDGTARIARTAALARPDIGGAYPAHGPNHGFDFSDLRLSNGAHQVCVYAINQAPGTANPQLGCRVVTTNGNPVGAVDAFTVAPGGVRVRGWAFDPDATGPISVRVYIDGHFRQAIDTGLPHEEATPGAGPNRGYSGVKINTSLGTHDVCVYAVNVGFGNNVTLRCRTVNVRTP